MKKALARPALWLTLLCLGIPGLTGCSMFRIVVPGQETAACIPLPPLTQAQRHAAALELAALTARDPDAVLPGLVKDYLMARARVRDACKTAGT